MRTIDRICAEHSAWLTELEQRLKRSRAFGAVAGLASQSDMTAVKTRTDQLNFGTNGVDADQSLDVRWMRTT
jgi:hypothetical protein